MSSPDRGLTLVADPVPRERNGEHAARYIKRLIFDGHLRAGDRVPQAEIAQALGISRIPIREGLISLERAGWVRNELHRGAFVVGLDEDAVRDHYALFGLVYGYAARRALAREETPLRVAAALEGISEALAHAADPAEVVRLALEFHATIVDAARSPRIGVLLAGMSGLVPGNFFAQVPGTPEVEKLGLSAIARAMRQGDGDAAVAGYEEMMSGHADLVVALLAERGFFDKTS